MFQNVWFCLAVYVVSFMMHKTKLWYL